MNEYFRKFSQKSAQLLGTPYAFIMALSIVVVWAVSGPFFGFSDSWELVINTTTTIITFLMVFLIQNTQNRDSKAVHLKLDELIKSVKKAHNKLIDAEDLSDEQLDNLKEHFRSIGKNEGRAL